MTKYKALYKGIHDDLKDSEMMIDYACEIRNEGDTELANKIALYAKSRLEHFKEFHQYFMDEIEKAPKVSHENPYECAWEETHEMMQEWYDKVKKKIEKF